jgi:hypothetical protein
MNQRFTLSHDVLGSLVISPPDGWSESKLKLERHPEYHSLIEYFDGSFIFYGSDGVSIDGGFNFIRQVEDTYGPDATINILIEITQDNVNYETVFIAQLDLSLSEELINNKIRVPIIRDDFWSKFISRNDTPVNVQSETGIDGGGAVVYPAINLVTTSQKVRQKYEGYNGDGTFVSDIIERWDIPANDYGIIDFPAVVLDEIETKYNYPIADSPTIPFELFDFKYGGEYAFDTKLCLWSIIDYSTVSTAIELYFKINDDTPIALTKTNIGTPAVDQRSEFTYTGSHTLIASDKVRLYIFNNSGGTVTVTMPKRGIFESYLKVTADTEFDDTDTKGFLLHDTASQIVERITGQPTPLYSEYLGGLLTQTRQYDANGCGWRYGLFKGLQVRQYTLTEKPFFLSFKDWWQGANPILNLGLGYEDLDTSPDNQVIRIEEKSHFYDENTSINFSEVRDITRVYDNDYIFNKIEIGYAKWNADDVSGIDDPQTKRTFATIFKKIGKSISLYSSFIAGLPFEIARRTTRKKSADYKYDNDTFIVSLNEDEVVESPDNGYLDFIPDISSTNGLDPIVSFPDEDGNALLNQETRYNLRITPARNFVRWLNYFCGSLQKNISSYFKFQSGDGYFKMSSHATLIFDNGCPGTTSPYGAINENSNIPVSGNDYLFIPKLFNITIPMELLEYQTIIQNRKKAIGISQTQSDHVPFFIKTLEYKYWLGQATITAWPKTEFTVTSAQECGIPPPDEGFILMETGDYILQEDGFLIELQ